MGGEATKNHFKEETSDDDIFDENEHWEADPFSDYKDIPYLIQQHKQALEETGKDFYEDKKSELLKKALYKENEKYIKKAFEHTNRKFNFHHQGLFLDLLKQDWHECHFILIEELQSFCIDEGDIVEDLSEISKKDFKYLKNNKQISTGIKAICFTIIAELAYSSGEKSFRENARNYLLQMGTVDNESKIKGRTIIKGPTHLYSLIDEDKK